MTPLGPDSGTRGCRLRRGRWPLTLSERGRNDDAVREGRPPYLLGIGFPPDPTKGKPIGHAASLHLFHQPWQPPAGCGQVLQDPDAPAREQFVKPIPTSPVLPHGVGVSPYTTQDPLHLANPLQELGSLRRCNL